MIDPTKLRELAARWRATAERMEGTAQADALVVCAAELLAWLVAEGDGWRPIAEMPVLTDREPIWLWSKEHIMNGQDPYPGGGWWKTLYGSDWLTEATKDFLAEEGITHWRRPLPPPPGEST